MVKKIKINKINPQNNKCPFKKATGWWRDECEICWQWNSWQSCRNGRQTLFSHACFPLVAVGTLGTTMGTFLIVFVALLHYCILNGYNFRLSEGVTDSFTLCSVLSGSSGAVWPLVWSFQNQIKGWEKVCVCVWRLMCSSCTAVLVFATRNACSGR